jgi:hypothetical protein
MTSKYEKFDFDKKTRLELNIKTLTSVNNFIDKILKRIRKTRFRMKDTFCINDIISICTKYSYENTYKKMQLEYKLSELNRVKSVYRMFYGDKNPIIEYVYKSEPVYKKQNNKKRKKEPKEFIYRSGADYDLQM